MIPTVYIYMESQERKFRKDVEKALGEYGEYSTKEIDEVMDILKDIGLKSTVGLKVIDRSTLEATNMKPAIVGILMAKFGDKTYQVENNSKWREGAGFALEILKAAAPFVAPIVTEKLGWRMPQQKTRLAQMAQDIHNLSVRQAPGCRRIIVPKKCP